MKMQRKLLSRESKNDVGRMSCGHLGSPKLVGQLFCHPKLIHKMWEVMTMHTIIVEDERKRAHELQRWEFQDYTQACSTIV
jgi:hypothetical protein